MAEERTELDANEPASAFKLEKARERGSIARSGELTFAMVMVACVACIYGLGTQVMTGTALLIRSAFSVAARNELGAPAVLGYFGLLAMHALQVLAPAVFVVWIAALLTGALQARGVFSAHPLTPDFSRLNPAHGLKRIFSIKALYELLRTILKIGAVAAAMFAWGRHHLETILRLPAQNPWAMAGSGLALLGSAALVLSALVLVFALLEWSFSRWEHRRRLRMSRREIRDEHKEREGDPRIKRRLRELRLEWLKRTRQIAKVRDADVLLTNPTHYAVALEYRHGEMPAPMITARGSGEMAQRMRNEARRRAVPVVENAPLARSLFFLGERETFVPEQHFEQVARVLRWVYVARARLRSPRASA
jgi:flagellar biosynthetic protein FlhB